MKQQQLFIILVFLAFGFLLGQQLAEGFVDRSTIKEERQQLRKIFSHGNLCSGLDERDCIQYPRCLWHIDINRGDSQGQCISRRDLPEKIKQDIWWDRMMDRYQVRHDPTFIPSSWFYTPRYYYTEQNYSPWQKYNLVTHQLV